MKIKAFWLRYLILVVPAVVAMVIFTFIPDTYRYLYGLLATLLILAVAFIAWAYHRPLDFQPQVPWGILLMVIVGIIGIGSMFVMPNNYWLNLTLGLIASQISAVYFSLVIVERKNKNGTTQMDKS